MGIMGFLEGSQIAILALEKAPAAVIKRTHRDAYFGHKLTQQRDNVRRYLLGRQFFVVFVDFIAAHSMGIGGLGILVPVSQLYPQLLAASNPAWFMSTWGSKGVLLLALIMEFCGFCHFSWGLFTIFFVIRNLVQSEEKADVGSVGQAVDIAGADVVAVDETSQDLGQLQVTVAEQQEKIRQLEAQIASRQNMIALRRRNMCFSALTALVNTFPKGSRIMLSSGVFLITTHNLSIKNLSYFMSMNARGMYRLSRWKK